MWKFNFWANCLTFQFIGLCTGFLLSACAPIYPIDSTRPNQAMKINDAYVFPIRPGSDAWRALQTHQEMLNATQIPVGRLQQMSTAGLVDTVLRYPLLGDILADFELQTGFERVSDMFNGLTELARRSDSGRILALRYQAMDPATVNLHWPIEQQGEYALSFTYVEVFLAQPFCLANLTANERRALLIDALHKQRRKLQHFAVYGYSAQEQSGLLIARILQFERYQSFTQQVTRDELFRHFVDRGNNSTNEMLKQIFTTAQQFLAAN